MGRRTPYPREVRGREDGFWRCGEYDSKWAAITSIAEKFGMTAETLRTWVSRSIVAATTLAR